MWDDPPKFFDMDSVDLDERERASLIQNRFDSFNDYYLLEQETADEGIGTGGENENPPLNTETTNVRPSTYVAGNEREIAMADVMHDIIELQLQKPASQLSNLSQVAYENLHFSGENPLSDTFFDSPHSSHRENVVVFERVFTLRKHSDSKLNENPVSSRKVTRTLHL